MKLHIVISKKIDKDSRKAYRNFINGRVTKLTSVDIFYCPAILAALYKIGISNDLNFYTDKIVQIAKTVIYGYGTIYPTFFNKKHHGHDILIITI